MHFNTNDTPRNGLKHGIGRQKNGSSDISSDRIVRKKKTAEQFVYLNNHKQMYKNEQQFSISCFWSL